MADERPGAAMSQDAKKAVQKKTGASKRAAKKTPTEKAPAKKTTAKKAPAGTKAARKQPAGKGPETQSTSTTVAKRTDVAVLVTPGTPRTVPHARTRVTRESGGSLDTALARRPSGPLHLATSAVGATAGMTLRVVSLPATTARRVLDRKGGLPAYVGAGALAATGVVNWPSAVGASVGYAALRRWGRQLPQPLRSLTGSNR